MRTAIRILLVMCTLLAIGRYLYPPPAAAIGDAYGACSAEAEVTAALAALPSR